MARNRAYHRYQRNRAINRKFGILRRIYGEEEPMLRTGDKLGRLSKGKIHCSCWMCKRHYWEEPTSSDRRKLEAWESRFAGEDDYGQD